MYHTWILHNLPVNHPFSGASFRLLVSGRGRNVPHDIPPTKERIFFRRARMGSEAEGTWIMVAFLGDGENSRRPEIKGDVGDLQPGGFSSWVTLLFKIRRNLASSIYPIHEGHLLFFWKTEDFFSCFLLEITWKTEEFIPCFFQATGNIPGFFRGCGEIDGNEQTATAAMSR